MDKRGKWREMIDRFAGAKMLVIGDVIVDHFVWGTVSRISPEAPVPVVNVSREELLLGGSANVLRNLISLGATGSLCGLIGTDKMGDQFIRLLEELGVTADGLVRGKRPTTVKTRVVAQGQQVVRFDREETGTPSRQSLDAFLLYLETNLAAFDGVIVSDYSKGVVNEELMVRLRHLLSDIRRKTGRALPLIVDPKPENMHRFTGATVITPNHHEASRMSEIAISDEQTLLAAARQIRDDIDCRAVLITRGEAGMALLSEDDTLVTIPTVAKEVYDVTGAGDTVAATLALGLATGIALEEAAVLANHAAGIVVGKVGTASVTADELMADLQSV
jgi:D-beta-D-heptose 7-phosphate kinase/D-beta-D-heptose 1-phosphate adenosyltransferase